MTIQARPDGAGAPQAAIPPTKATGQAFGRAARLAASESVTWRAILIAVVLVPLQTWWIVQMEVVSFNTWPTMLSLPLASLFLLLLLTVLNRLLRFPRRLSQGELLTVYVMLAISGGIAGYGVLQSLVAWVIAPGWRATPENRWDQLFAPYLPNWLVVQSRNALQPIFEGSASLLTPAHLQAWATPGLAWSGFLLALFGALLATNTLVRRRWIEEERLTFPLLQLPLAISEPTGRVFRSVPLWVGFGLTSVLGLLNGLHYLYPAMPSFQFNPASLNGAFGVRPWSAAGAPFYPLYWWAVGVSVMMPLDVSFSYWFFFWSMVVEKILTAQLGWDIAPEAPFVYHQSAGALIAVGLASLWGVRRHLRQVFRQALRRGCDLKDEDEPLRYRAALALLIACVIFLAVFCRAAGIPLWLVGPFLVLYLTATIALSRMRAEFGAPAVEVTRAGPYVVLTQLLGPSAFPARGLTALVLFGWTSRSYGMDPTPLQIEGFKMAERSGLRTPGLVGAMIIAVVVALPVGFCAVLAPLYRLGAGTVKMQWDQVDQAVAVYSQLQSWLTGYEGTHGLEGAAIGGGFLFSAFLFAMRARFLWWPFHPIGYVLAPMWYTNEFWPSIFLAWLLKLVLLRYGGMRTYHRALPFFLGLILGDCVIGSIWAILGLCFNVPTFNVWM